MDVLLAICAAFVSAFMVSLFHEQNLKIYTRGIAFDRAGRPDLQIFLVNRQAGNGEAIGPFVKPEQGDILGTPPITPHDGLSTSTDNKQLYMSEFDIAKLTHDNTSTNREITIDLHIKIDSEFFVHLKELIAVYTSQEEKADWLATTKYQGFLEAEREISVDPVLQPTDMLDNHGATVHVVSETESEISIEPELPSSYNGTQDKLSENGYGVLGFGEKLTLNVYDTNRKQIPEHQKLIDGVESLNSRQTAVASAIQDRVILTPLDSRNEKDTHYQLLLEEGFTLDLLTQNLLMYTAQWSLLTISLVLTAATSIVYMFTIFLDRRATAQNKLAEGVTAASTRENDNEEAKLKEALRILNSLHDETKTKVFGTCRTVQASVANLIERVIRLEQSSGAVDEKQGTVLLQTLQSQLGQMCQRCDHLECRLESEAVKASAVMMQLDDIKRGSREIADRYASDRDSVIETLLAYQKFLDEHLRIN